MEYERPRSHVPPLPIISQLMATRKSVVLCIVLVFLSLCEFSSSFSHFQDVNKPKQVWDNRIKSPGITFPYLSAVRRSSFEDDLALTSVAPKVPTDRSTVKEFQMIRLRVVDFLKQNDFQGAKELIRGMIEYIDEASQVNKHDRQILCEVVDEAFQIYFSNAFAAPYKGRDSCIRVSFGLELLKLQLSSTVLDPPYNKVPKRTLLIALKALTGVNEAKQTDLASGSLTNTNAAYRILQRLVTGVGVRNVRQGGMKLFECDFNMVLNAYSNVGHMAMAHRIVALQERTPGAPDLSPVAYSILLKGYGRLGDLNNIEMLLTHAEVNGVEPDIIMLNSLIHAYINCNNLANAREVFNFMRNPHMGSKFGSEHGGFFSSSACPAPNQRTYNTFLKGLAYEGLLDESIDLSEDMQCNKLWNHVTTNTLVLAAVKAEDFDFAEQILEEHTLTNAKSGRHPNLEAYTTVIDGYAKAGNMIRAIDFLKFMEERHVEPNEYTYTCLIGGLARNKKLGQAKRMMAFMKSTRLRVSTVTYNSFISGLVFRGPQVTGEDYDAYVDEAIKILRQMIKIDKIQPNIATVSVIVNAFGSCDRPRIAEAAALVEKLEIDSIIPRNNTKILTSLVQVYGAGGDLAGAVKTFRKIRKPDVAAINCLMDACVRSSSWKMVSDTFDFYFRTSSPRRRPELVPDLVSFSILITSLMKKNDPESTKSARKLYEEMKFRRRFVPDKALVDM